MMTMSLALLVPLATAAPLTQVWSAESNQADAYMSLCLGSFDANGDGFDDLYSSAHAYDHGQADEGGVAVWLGSAVGLQARPSWTMEGDARNALACGESVGDVNGDGYDDLLVGMSGYDRFSGAVALYYGSSTGLEATPSWTVYTAQQGASFGQEVAGAGDVNGDGYDDFLVGAPTADGALPYSGRVDLWLGGPTGPALAPDWTTSSDRPNTQWGGSVGSAGDVNGDGYDDVLIGVPYYGGPPNDAGAMFLFLGSPFGLESTEAWSTVATRPFVDIGWGSGHADVNGDGYSDVLVPTFGRVDMYFGSPSGLAQSPDWTDLTTMMYEGFGFRAVGVGDLDGDGYEEIAIGAEGATYDQPSEGAFYVYAGGPAGPAPSPTIIVEGDRPGSSFGWTLAAGGDTDGDGRLEVMVGASDWNHPQVGEGAAFLYEAP